MKNSTVRFAVSLAIHEGKLEAFKSVAHELIAGTRTEVGSLGYDWYLSSDQKHCRVLETYADENAVLSHLKGPVVQTLVPKLLEVASVNAFEVYGNPGAEASKMLVSWGAATFAFWDGIKK